MSEANRDEAMKCLGIARKARAEGDFAKAKRFAEKAKSLYPCAEVCLFCVS
jgi:DnaJ family protein B protein 12